MSEYVFPIIVGMTLVAGTCVGIFLAGAAAVICL